MTGDDEIQVEDDDIGAQIRAAAEQVSSAKAVGDKLSSGDDSSSSSEVPEVGAERARDASGRFTKSVEQTTAPDTPVSDAVQPTEQPQERSQASLTPPRGWSAEEKAMFTALPPAIQAAVSRREEQFSQGAQQWTERVRQYEQAVAPASVLSQQYQMPEGEVIKRLVDAERRLQQDAPNAIAELAQAYGVDLAALVNGSPQPQRQAQQSFDPNIIPQLVERQVTEKLTAYQQDQALNSEIQQFAGARGADGQAAHPHFEAVKSTMGILLQSGQAQTMQEAYDKAIWLSPETRPQPQIQVNSQQQVQKAKKAAVSVNGAPMNGTPKPKGFDANQSLVDDIREAAAMVQRH